MPHDPGEQDSQVLGGAWGEVQLGGVAHKVDGAVVEGVPRGVPGGALVVHIGHAGVVGLVEALVEGHTALPTCHQHQAPSCSMLNPQPSTLNPQPSTLNAQCSMLNAQCTAALHAAWPKEWTRAL